jgi:hypothetical protein
MEYKETSRLNGGFEVLHSVANRVRLRAVDSKTRAGLDNVAQQLKQEKGIRQVDTKKQTGSLVILFDPEQLSLERIKQLLQTFGGLQEQEEFDASFSQGISQAGSNLISFIPPIVGLTAIRAIGTVGWQAFATYFVAANVTRGIMGSLELGCLEPRSNEASKISVTEKSINEPIEQNYKIVHQLPGRVRLQIPAIGRDRNYVKKLDRLAKQESKIKSLRVNPATTSVLISYEKDLDLSDLLVLIQAAIESTNSVVVVERSNNLNSNLNSSKDASEENESSDLEQPQLPSEDSVEAIANGEIAKIEEEEEERSSSLVDLAVNEIESELSAENSESELIVSLDNSSDASENETPNLEQNSPWTNFKSCALSAMLRLMANLSGQPANA